MNSNDSQKVLVLIFYIEPNILYYLCISCGKKETFFKMTYEKASLKTQQILKHF